jgi:RNA polymerase primary sigma factor
MKIYKRITSQDSDQIGRYFNDIKKYEPLSKEEEFQLIDIIQARGEGERKALDKLVKHNLKFVISVAKKYQNQGAPLMDLISEGNSGLIEAAYRFDRKVYDNKFFSYAVWWISIRIINTFSINSRLIQLPANRTELLKKVKRELVNLEQELGRKPTHEEVAENLKRFPALKKLVADEVQEVLMHESSPVSLQAKAKEEDEESPILADTIPAETKGDIMDEVSLPIELDRFLHYLGQDQADVLSLSLGLHGEDPHSIDDLADKFSIPKKEVTKIKMKGLKRLRKMKNVDELRNFI